MKSAAPLTPGRTVGRYEIVARLGTGGMAEVALARARGPEGFEKWVALKRILPHLAADDVLVARFLHEARLVAAIEHPHVAAVFDVGEDEGLPFFAMEHVHGEDLHLVMGTLASRGQIMPVEHAVAITMAAAAGLHAAHELRSDGAPAGIVHGDVSPRNVLVSYAGAVKVIDFGIARAAHAPGPPGSLSYLSPEQAAGGAVDRRSDVFALGLLLFELTTGTRAYDDATTLPARVGALEAAAIPSPAARIAGYPAALEAIVRRALARAPADRFASARQLEEALGVVARAEGWASTAHTLGAYMEQTFGPKPTAAQLAARVPARPAAAPAAPPPSARATSPVPRTRFAMAGAALLAAGAGAAGAWWLGGAASDRPAPPVVVVAERGAVTREGPEVRAAARPPDAAGARAPRPEPLARPARKPSPTGPSAAFAREQKALERCFLAHAAHAKRAGRIAVEFKADRDGRVVSAVVVPPAIARTDLGTCVASVAARVRFGRQPAPVAFTIPVRFDAAEPGR